MHRVIREQRNSHQGSSAENADKTEQQSKSARSAHMTCGHALQWLHPTLPARPWGLHATPIMS